MYEFATKGFEESHDENMGDMPKRLEGLERSIKEATDVWTEFTRSLDILFERMHLGFIPKPIRYSMLILFLFSPVIGICYVLIFEEDDTLTAAKIRAERNQQHANIDKGSKVNEKGSVKTKRDKIE